MIQASPKNLPHLSTCSITFNAQSLYINDVFVRRIIVGKNLVMICERSRYSRNRYTFLDFENSPTTNHRNQWLYTQNTTINNVLQPIIFSPAFDKTTWASIDLLIFEEQTVPKDNLEGERLAVGGGRPGGVEGRWRPLPITKEEDARVD